MARWMGRVEAAIFAPPRPVPREGLAELVGDDWRLDALSPLSSGSGLTRS